VTARLSHLFLAAALSASACSRAGGPPEFIVTAEPLEVTAGLTKLCVAVDVQAKDGVWWWQPGASGCDSRSTGPTPFRGEAARVYTWHLSRGHSAEFQLQRMVPPRSTDAPNVHVRVTLREGRMSAVATGATVPTVRRPDLEIPEKAVRVVRR
jgi:hypothetical protein